MGGTLLGTCGALVLTVWGRTDQGVTLIGDLACGASMIGFICYFSIGRHLRSWVPLFTYMLLITCKTSPAPCFAALLTPELLLLLDCGSEVDFKPCTPSSTRLETGQALMLS